MTREEAIKMLKSKMDGHTDTSYEWAETVRMAIQALQQSCEDIAKAFQFGMALGFGERHDEMDRVMEEVKKVITPQPKTGHWDSRTCKCSECGYQIAFSEYAERKYKYCPNCGARMEREEYKE